MELAEQAFATELQRLTAHLAERLTGLHDGQPKVFRDSAVENLREFFERFRRLNIRSSPELAELVQQAQQTITGIEPQTLRDSNRLRQMVAQDFEQIPASGNHEAAWSAQGRRRFQAHPMTETGL